MIKNVIISFDLEHDIGPDIKYDGIDVFLRYLLPLFKKYDILLDAFVSTDVLLRYTTELTNVNDINITFGNHNLLHDFLCKNSYKQQYEEIFISTEVFKDKFGRHPLMFRAPNFAVNLDTIRILDELGYKIDSSILPGRKPRKFRIFPVLLNFSKAPRCIYHPAFTDFLKEGNMNILEVPVTSNPFCKGIPIGGGALSYYGLEKTITMLNIIKEDNIIMLFHPWEFLNRENSKSPALKVINDFEQLLIHIKSNFNLAHLKEL